MILLVSNVILLTDNVYTCTAISQYLPNKKQSVDKLHIYNIFALFFACDELARQVRRWSTW